MSTKTRADRYAATIIQHGLLTFDDCEAVAAELRRLAASEAALLAALEVAHVRCTSKDYDRFATLIARTKEARNA